MAYQAQDRMVEPGDRLFDPLHAISIFFDALATSLDVHLGRRMSRPDEHIAMACTQHAMKIRLPLFSPVFSVAHNRKVGGIEFRVEPDPNAVSQQKFDHDISGFVAASDHFVKAIFVQFYEGHEPWFVSHYGGDKSRWPGVISFARIVRNAVIHHHGAIHFDNARAAAVSWQGLSYSPADNGHPAVGPGRDLSYGDLLILMTEMADLIDADGCPFVP